LNRRKAADLLIAAGVVAWIPYAILKHIMGYHVPVLPFLVAHLMGVLPGSYLRFLERRERKKGMKTGGEEN
jgi:uncharacterized membrane protein